MTTSPNRTFNNYTFGPTQKMVEDLLVEAIRIHGLWVYYLPRTKIDMDYVLGEDRMSKFEDAVKIEVYVKNFEGFEGQRLMSKLGVEIHDEINFTMAKRRFEEVRAEHLLEENGQSLEQELTNRHHAGQFNGILLEEGGIEGYYIEYDRPRAGDLIYLPFCDKLFEIKFVQHDQIFHQMGTLQTYDLFCELFEYSHEEMNTGNETIDNIEDLWSGDMTKHDIDTEAGEDVTQEDGDGKIIQDDFTSESVDYQANNNLFRTESDGVIDFSEISPFVKRDRNFKW